MKKSKPDIPRPSFETSNFVLRRGESGSKEPDEKLKTAVLDGCLVVYVDEWTNHRTMEARAYGLTPGDRPVIIGYQLDGGQGIPPVQMWKAIDDLDRIFVKESGLQFVERTIPSQYASQLIKMFALAPGTGLDLSSHEADGY
ncbi:hypothetical protein PQQ52_17830 [Paraburkholderia sediminicola]|uniref:hypothetical protein n=1 Tax=Paraburkholderia sediminicola TaxID=458836 RepID=UPI0038B6E7C9